jgi:Rrf2 family protein
MAMKISTKGRYGMQLMLDLAVHRHGSAVVLKDIAARQTISEKYLWQVIAPLKAAGLITSIRGAHGGYALAKAPADITVKEILTTLEGAEFFTSGAADGKRPTSIWTAVTGELWSELERKLAKAMEAVTLADLARRYGEQREHTALNFTI